MLNEDTNLFEEIDAGSTRQFDLHIARLPTGTAINIHVFVYRGKDPGATLLLTGGLHGDEVNGIEIIRRMMEGGNLMPEAGTVIAIPVLNIYGFLNFARDLPDGKDANRSFPGTRNGSLASRMAFAIKNRILPWIDFGLDFHTGGGNRTNFPQIRCDFNDEKSVELAEAFSPPFIVHSQLIPQSLRNEAKNQGKSLIVYEAGEAMRFDETGINEGIAGTKRLMHFLKMRHMDKTDEKQSNENIKLPRTTWIRAENAGIFNTIVSAGDFLQEGQLIGFLSDPYNIYKMEIASPASGYVIGLNNTPVVNAGDALLHLGLTENK